MTIAPYKKVYITVFFHFQHDLIQNRLNELFNSLAVERQITQSDTKAAQLQASNEKPIYETNFPELFYY